MLHLSPGLLVLTFLPVPLIFSTVFLLKNKWTGTHSIQVLDHLTITLSTPLFNAKTVEGHIPALDTLISINANAKAVNKPFLTSLKRQRCSGAAENITGLEQGKTTLLFSREPPNEAPRETDRSCTLGVSNGHLLSAEASNLQSYF